MKKLCFAVVFSLLCFVNQVKADLHGDFLRIECNQDLGLLEISHYYINGSKIGDYFFDVSPFYDYQIDNSGEHKANVDMHLINGLDNDKLPYTYRCQLSDESVYDIFIDEVTRGDCVTLQNLTFAVSIVEKKDDAKQILKNVEIGCNTSVKNIYLTDNDNDFSVAFVSNNETIYQVNSFKTTITDAAVKNELNKLIHN